MRNLFQTPRIEEVKDRLLRLKPDSPRQWGVMTPTQALAHCSAGLEMAMGRICPPRLLIGRILGRVVKPIAFRDEEPLRRNVATAKELIAPDGLNFETEQRRLSDAIDRFAAAGPAGCSTHPHFFFGRLTPDEWAVLTYKHLDHHLRQFGV